MTAVEEFRHYTNRMHLQPQDYEVIVGIIQRAAAEAATAEREACVAFVRDAEYPIGFMTAEERHIVRMTQDSLAKAIETRGLER